MIVVRERTFDHAWHFLCDAFSYVPAEPQKRWQGVDVSAHPAAKIHNLDDVVVNVPLRGISSLAHWRDEVKPNLPWADDHFAERVSGAPMNPGTEWANWPWGKSAAGFTLGGMFNHNYMERYWPKYAGRGYAPTVDAEDWRRAIAHNNPDASPKRGIRGEYGDLGNVVELLVSDPFTRQAYLPIFFPEDTGIGDGGRKPCTLGYQFIRRGNALDVFYPMRSCDFYKHYRDDVYLTIRLLLWVISQCQARDDNWHNVIPGSYSMWITNLHLFVNDHITLFKKDRV